MNKIFRFSRRSLSFASLSDWHFVFHTSRASQRDRTIENELVVNWEKLGPGGGGATFIPTFSYQTPQNFLVRCDMTGSYLTNDGGISYQQVNFANGANAYAFDPDNANSIWIGSTTLKHSTDGGKNWELVFPRKEEIMREVFHDDHASYSIETSDSSLYVSEYGRIGTIRIDPAMKGAMYFSMGEFFFFSYDNGKTWSREKLHQRIEYVYTNATVLKNEVVIFTAELLYKFNKTTHQFIQSNLPGGYVSCFFVHCWHGKK